MKIAYIGVPLALGADRMGVEKAPDFFRNSGIVRMMSNLAGCYDFGNVQSAIVEGSKYATSVKVKYLQTVVDITVQLRDKVSSALRQGYFPLIVGGDHSLGLGSAAGAALACDNLGVIWLDAHGDFNTEDTSPSGNLHGMPCAALMGWCNSELKKVAKRNIPPKNFYWIGCRDLDRGELQMAKEHNLHIFSTKDVRKKGIDAVMREVIDGLKLQKINKVHLSIDIDAMDPQIVCGTGVRVENGLLNGEFYTFLDEIFSTGKVVSTDFVEYNKMLDDEDMTTAKWCFEALHYLTLKIKGL